MGECFMCDAGLPAKRTVGLNVLMEDGSVRTLSLNERAHQMVQAYLTEIRMVRHQRECATRFNRRLRSIRATLHLVRR